MGDESPKSAHSSDRPPDEVARYRRGKRTFLWAGLAGLAAYVVLSVAPMVAGKFPGSPHW